MKEPDSSTKRPAPCFPFYVDDFISGTSDLTPHDVGCYVRLLCYQWNRGSIPVQTEKQQRVAGGAISADVIEKFQKWDDGLLRNKRLEDEREKRNAYKELQRQKGILSAESRRNRGSTEVQPEGQPEVNLPFPFPKPNISPPYIPPLGGVGDGPSGESLSDQQSQPDAASVTGCKSSKLSVNVCKPSKPDPAATVPIPAELDTPEFRAEWAAWLQDRRQRRRPVTPEAARRQFKRLVPMGPQVAIQSIEQSIEKGWPTFYPVSSYERNNAPRTADNNPRNRFIQKSKAQGELSYGEVARLRADRDRAKLAAEMAAHGNGALPGTDGNPVPG